ncbi:MAG TPA: F0F1 ATP synthase subunit delta [Gammaproteobacteria bacterium]|jgi:F-type H+-transporting ATPase subunit delta|nr:F0F1 ATP synthase subunit delta [Gammaproteobacteria bacterium]
MANLTSIARPYAKAAFDVARQDAQFSEWKVFLETAALIVKDATVIDACTDPETDQSKLLAFFESLLSSLLNAHRKNFLALLLETKRILVLPVIAELYNELLASEANLSTVTLTTAVDIDEATRNAFALALKKRTQKEITLQCRLDPAILGGAIIQIGDRVIDGSIRGKLARLLEFSLR